MSSMRIGSRQVTMQHYSTRRTKEGSSSTGTPQPPPLEGRQRAADDLRGQQRRASDAEPHREPPERP